MHRASLLFRTLLARRGMTTNTACWNSPVSLDCWPATAPFTASLRVASPLAKETSHFVFGTRDQTQPHLCYGNELGEDFESWNEYDIEDMDVYDMELSNNEIWAHTKRTYQPSNVRRKRTHGFLKRLKSVGGRRVIKRRRMKGRKYVSV